MYSKFLNSVPFDLLVKEIKSLILWYLSKMILINSDISIYQWLIKFQLGFDLLMHYTWVAVKSLLLNHKFSHSCWSNGQNGWLPLSEGLRLWVRICSGDEKFFKIIFEIKCLKNSQKWTQKSDKIINRLKRTELWNVLYKESCNFD